MSTNSNEASTKTKLRVGFFTLATLLLLGALSIYVNNRPFWWRPCDSVMVTVEDATGLKTKAPVKSLGLDIGFIEDIAMVPNGVKLKICITAPVEVVPDTKAFVRAEGFLGDRFLELKPVRYTGTHRMEDAVPNSTMSPQEGAPAEQPAQPKSSNLLKKLFWISDAYAQADAPPAPNRTKGAKEIPIGEKAADMQQVMGQLNTIMTSLKESIRPEEIRSTIKQLNDTLKDASKAFSPQGGLTATAQRSLIKLEDAIEQLRDQATRINQGKGSVGMVLNDPYYADELKKAITSVNKLLGRASEIKLLVNLGIQEMDAWTGARSSFQLSIWPKPDRYYLIGISSDPRGTVNQVTNTVDSNGITNTTRNTTNNKGGFSYSVMIGKVFAQRFDLAVGLLYGDGAASLGINLGWDPEHLEQIQLKNELYFRSQADGAGNWTALADGRSYLIFQPISIFYLSGGIEGYRKVGGKLSTFYGAGIRFEDEDIKLLFSFL
ncbi:MAG: MCE family protein [Bdellovibrionales bacterium]|nr:MCE family protein [Bdellovibrionales bacterium]